MNRKVRVLQLADHLNVGGAERLQYTMAQAVDRSRFDWHVCALRAMPGSPIVKDLRALGVPVTEFNQTSAYDVKTIMALVSYIRRNQIDIIHTHLAGADIAGRIAGFLTHRPVVSSIHLIQGDLSEAPERRKMLLRWTARFMCKRLIVVADNMREETAEWFGLPLSKVVSIPNGVDTQQFRPRTGFDRVAMKIKLIGGDYPLVTNVARLTNQKAQKNLIAAVPQILAQLPEARFLIVGDGPNAEQLAQQVTALGLQDRVTLTGPRTDVPDILAASDLFVLSSLQEGLPVALLEAMAAGCPAASTNVGGVSSVLHDGDTGCLIKPNDVSALAEALTYLLSHPEQAEQMGLAGQRLINREYDMRAWARKLENEYLRELGLSDARQSAKASEIVAADH